MIVFGSVIESQSEDLDIPQAADPKWHKAVYWSAAQWTSHMKHAMDTQKYIVIYPAKNKELPSDRDEKWLTA